MASKFSVVDSIRGRVSEIFIASLDKQRLSFTPAVVTLLSQVLTDSRERCVADEAVVEEEGKELKM